MTSPYSSNLLQHPVEEFPRPRRGLGERLHLGDGDDPVTDRRIEREPVHTSSITRVVTAPEPTYAPMPMPMPAQAPQVMYVQSAPSGSGKGAAALSSALLAIVVILVGVVALVGGYAATRAAAPSSDEAALTAGIAVQQGFDAGRSQGLLNGRSDALVAVESTSSLRASIARNTAFQQAYRRGLTAGGKYRAPVSRGYSSGGGSSYRAPSFGGFGGFEVASALGQAQNLANITGAPVDVEIY